MQEEICKNNFKEIEFQLKISPKKFLALTYFIANPTKSIEKIMTNYKYHKL